MMTPRACCKHTTHAAGWLLPTATLALLPKCPACLAAYLTLATGLGVSFPTAAYLRTSLILASAFLLLFVTARLALRWFRKPPRA